MSGEVAFFLQVRLETVGSFVQRGAFVGFAWSDGGSAEACEGAGDLIVEFFLLSRRDSGDVDLAELGFLAEAGLEDDVYDAVPGVGLKPGGDIGFEVALLLEEAEESPAILLNCGSVVGSLRSVVGDLDEAGVGVAFRAGELEDSVPDCWLENVENSEALRERFDLNTDFLELASFFESSGGGFHFFASEGLAFFLNEFGLEVGCLEVRTAGNLDGGDGLTFVGGEDLFSGREIGVLRDLLRLSGL